MANHGNNGVNDYEIKFIYNEFFSICKQLYDKSSNITNVSISKKIIFSLKIENESLIKEVKLLKE